MSARLTIDEVKNRLYRVHGDIVSLDESTYVNTNIKAKFIDKEYGEWWAVVDSVFRGHCKFSRKRKSFNSDKSDILSECKDIAKLRNGEFLSTTYINARLSLVWKCNTCLFVWNNNFDNIKNKGQWCPNCANIKRNDKNKLNLDICKEIAKNKEGECLSFKYINNHTKLEWKCKHGHIWCAILQHVKDDNTWCPECAREKYKSTMMKKYGVEHNSKSRILMLKILRSSSRRFIIYHWKTGEEIICVGTYEIKVVMYLNQNRVDFEWQIPFQMPNGKVYFVDALLKDRNTYIEIKGYFRKDAKEKWDWFHEKYSNSELWDEKKLKELKIL